MRPRRVPGPAAGYTLAVASSVAAVGLRLLLGETTRLIFVTFYPAVMASAWWGGRGPAMLAMALCALAADYGWLSPRGSLFPSTAQEWTDLFLFIVVAGALGIVTARLRDVQVRLHSLLEKTSDGFAIIDRSWRYRYVNPRFAAMVRKQPRELLGRRVWDVFPDSHDTTFAKVARTAMDGVPGHATEIYGPLSTCFDTTLYPVREGVAVIARDVTAAKELEQHRAELLQRAEEANRAKDEFLATLSHELRQPLNALVGWAEMMDRVPAERAIPSIRRNAAALSQLVHDLLDTSRIMAGKLHMKVAATDLAAVVRDVSDTLRPSAERKGIAVSVGGADLPVWVMGDGGRLRQAVLNLLSNAVKFTPENGRIDVTLAETDTATVMLTVRDTGVGIPPDILPHVFDRFVQAETSARVGLGLGLAITKHIAEAHGGSVHAESGGPMQGATFTLTLPLARSTASTAHPRQSRENVHS